jgi:hypothetical protein
MPSGRRRRSRLLRWLTPLLLFVGVLSMMSYATGAAFLLRIENPAVGAWWDTYQFYFMEGAATALGLVFAIRIARRLISDPEIAARCTVWAAILAVLAFAPLIHLCALAARLLPDTSGIVSRDWIIGLAGYEVGRYLDKVSVAAVYFLKTACLALIAGLALFGIAVAVNFATEGAANGEPQSDLSSGS